MTDLTELRRLTEALIDPEYGGRWSATHGPRELPRIWADDQGVTAEPIFVAKSVEDAPEAEFVAAANPAVVLELLDAAEALTAEPTEAEVEAVAAVIRENRTCLSVEAMAVGLLRAAAEARR